MENLHILHSSAYTGDLNIGEYIFYSSAYTGVYAGHNKDIERVGTGCKNESFKFVGVHLDENLNWNQHLKVVKNKASSAVFALSSVKNILPSNIKLTIYNSLFRSFIEYGISAWGRNKCSEMK